MGNMAPRHESFCVGVIFFICLLFVWKVTPSLCAPRAAMVTVPVMKRGVWGGGGVA